MTPTTRFEANKLLFPGRATGPLIPLDEPLSFWGGYDPERGIIIDRAHPQHGCSLAGAVVAMAGSRGSSGTPGVLGEALRRGTGPAAMLITKPDVNLAAGAMVAAALYGVVCPIVVVADGDFPLIRTHATAAIVDGVVELSPTTAPAG